MRVIDLLNKIANGEEVPKIIQWGELLFEWEEQGFHDYKSFGTGEHLLFQGFATSCLNDEVEIIEEDKKIKKLKVEYAPDIEEKVFYEDGDKPNHCILGDVGTELLIDKINEIIDVLNKE